MRLVPEYIGMWGMKAAELGIKVKGIYVDSKASRDLVSTTGRMEYEVVYVPTKNYPSPVDQIIFDDKVGYLIVEGKKITSIFVEAPEIGTLIKGMFDVSFEEAKRNGGKYVSRHAEIKGSIK